MQYEQLEEAGRLVVKYDGPDLDLFTFAQLQLHVQEIVDQVVIANLQDQYPYYPYDYPFRRRRGYYRGRRADSRSVLRTEVTAVRYGSYEIELTFFLAAFADPNVRAALQSFAGSVIFAISSSGIRGVRRLLRRGNEEETLESEGGDRFDVGPNIRGIIRDVSESLDGKRARIRFKRDNDGNEEVDIIIGDTE